MSAVDANVAIQVKDDQGNPRYHTLLVVQPSSLNPTQMNNLLDALRAGQHAVLFEDPFPAMTDAYVGTYMPKRPRNNPMFGGGAPPEQKGDISKLWELLGVELQRADPKWAAMKNQQVGGLFGQQSVRPEFWIQPC